MRWCSSGSLLLLFSSLAFAGSEFKICSYNVQNFNQEKALNYRVIHTLTRVISRYDICLLQHVIDSDGKAIKTLLASLNRYDDDCHYKSVSSKPLGRSADDMQQYVFIYRTETVNLTDQYQYQRSGSFLREPFIVQFQSRHTAIQKFILVPLHTDPPKAVQEIDRLYDVFEEASKKWKNTNVMFLGDFHAACAYVTRANRKNIRLYTNTSFSWLIRDKADTTVGDDTNCAYDRIVVYGNFLKGISPLSAKAYNIGRELRLTKSKVLEVSDHFPVEVKLKSSGLLLQATPLLILLVQCWLSTL